MPELPDITAYIEALNTRVVGHVLERVHLFSPFVLRSVTPPVAHVEGRRVIELRRLGKQIVFCLEGGFFIVVHLMIAGRFQWNEKTKRAPGRIGLAALEF